MTTRDKIAKQGEKLEAVALKEPYVFSYPLSKRAAPGTIVPLPQPVEQRPPHFARPTTLREIQAQEESLKAGWDALLHTFQRKKTS